jgi:hypothetical protein
MQMKKRRGDSPFPPSPARPAPATTNWRECRAPRAGFWRPASLAITTEWGRVLRPRENGAGGHRWPARTRNETPVRNHAPNLQILVIARRFWVRGTTACRGGFETRPYRRMGQTSGQDQDARAPGISARCVDTLSLWDGQGGERSGRRRRRREGRRPNEGRWIAFRHAFGERSQ